MIDLHEMEKFISVAMGTIAGEGHEVQDRLINLSILCTKFTPLIYHLNESEECNLMKYLNCISETAKRVDGCTDDLDRVLVGTGKTSKR